MKNFKLITIITTFFVTSIENHLILNETKDLHPVHGLFVKPSNDGSTGDLYVAATEENGEKSQWLADTSINFLTTSEKTAPETTKATSQEEILTNQQKIVASPKLKYAYVLPVPRSASNLMPLPYTIATVTSPCTMGSSQNLLQLYPQMLSSVANAMNSLYETSNQKSSNTPLQATQFWPTGFPLTSLPPYIVMAPRSWTQTQKGDNRSTETETESTSIEIS